MGFDTLEPEIADLKASIQLAWSGREVLNAHPGLEKCVELEEKVFKAEHLATNATVLARALAAKLDADQILNMTEVGDAIYPMIQSGSEWLDDSARCIVEGQAHLCQGELVPRFDLARKQFETAYSYLVQWPRSCSEHLALVRQEIAKGQIDFVVDASGCTRGA